MTKHPLTDEKCEILSRQPFLDPETDVEATIHDMRAAADWQLEQMIEWLKVNLIKHDFHEGYAYLYDDCSNAEIEVDKVLEDLKQAMRPQQQENN
jgi:hypothetical protein